MSKDPSIVKMEVKNYFENKFNVQERVDMNMDDVHFSSISQVDNEMLYGVITENEILATVSQCGSTKSPGPDGFNFHLSKVIGRFWRKR